MDLLPTEEQEAIAVTARELLAKRGYPSALRALGSAGVDEELWTECAALGWLGVGELGAGFEVMLCRELGRHLAPGPFLPNVLAAHAATVIGDAELAKRLVEGSARAAVAHRWDDGLQVLHGPGADVVLVAVDGGLSLVGMDAVGSLEDVTPLDPATPVARAAGREWQGRRVADAQELIARATLLPAAFLCGIAEATRDQAAEHARTRQQFGQPIGAFQAVKHRCADMATRAEAAWAQTCFAAAALDGGRDDGGTSAAAAKVVALLAARQNAADNIQVHGGMGFTAEHDAHLFVKRTHVWETALGGRQAQLARLL